MCWNTRGLNGPNKKKEVKLFCNEQQVGLVGILENKIKSNKLPQVAEKMFGGWEYVTNLEAHYNGRVWITWKPDYYHITPVSQPRS